MNVVLSDMKTAQYAAYVWDVSPRNKKNRVKEESSK